ncbi:D-aminoacyl-tRNA deacylase [Curtobacterium sp. S6]|uniref:D-aminoacyl-tRNA deacylase n=1 Tax=Curtobacterium sp. S6 TaxID=1479623 RepID=UPI0004AA3D9B|nr:D-aminoacyl-tRNA deacylase [Curtobacterium sp. S6]
MRIVLQRVLRASVTVDREIVGHIERPGLLALVGVTHQDGDPEIQKLADKTCNLRILEDEKSCLEAGAPILAVSQFTLYGDAKKGRRPSWAGAAPSQVSEPVYDRYVDRLRELGATVETGRFGADMSVELVNDGPVTLILDSADLL